MGRGCTPSRADPPPKRQQKRAVRILLECILVLSGVLAPEKCPVSSLLMSLISANDLLESNSDSLVEPMLPLGGRVSSLPAARDERSFTFSPE